MSEDFITRLRGQLVDAAAAPARRPAVRAVRLRPALAAAVVLVAVVLGASTLERPLDDDRPAAATVALRVTGAEATPAAGILQDRVDAVGLDADVRVADGVLLVDLDEDTPAARRTLEGLLPRGRLAMYDWEASLVGRGPLSRDEAARLAEQEPERTVVEHEGGWFVLKGPPALANPDVADAEQGVDPMTGDPVVDLEFTDEGAQAFHDLTRGVALRGADEAEPGESAIEAAQHFAIVVDARVLALPYIDHMELPDGLDDGGAYIHGGLSMESARELAAVLDSGPMVGTLAPR